jgi:enoyl-CoA hydratase/carnithine racemase
MVLYARALATGNFFDAADALDMNLIQEVVDDADVIIDGAKISHQDLPDSYEVETPMARSCSSHSIA